jgi:hypothetical protein
MAMPTQHTQALEVDEDQRTLPTFCPYTGLSLIPLPTPSPQALAAREDEDKRGMFRVYVYLPTH